MRRTRSAKRAPRGNCMIGYSKAKPIAPSRAGSTGLGGYTVSGARLDMPAGDERGNTRENGAFTIKAFSDPDTSATSGTHFDDLLAYRTLPVDRRGPKTVRAGFDTMGTLLLALTLAAYALAMTIGRGRFGPLNIARANGRDRIRRPPARHHVVRPKGPGRAVLRAHRPQRDGRQPRHCMARSAMRMPRLGVHAPCAAGTYFPPVTVGVIVGVVSAAKIGL